MGGDGNLVFQPILIFFSAKGLRYFGICLKLVDFSFNLVFCLGEGFGTSAT